MSSLACVILLGWIQISAFQQKNVQIAKYKFRASFWFFLNEFTSVIYLVDHIYVRGKKSPSFHYLGLKKSYLTKNQTCKWLQALLRNMGTLSILLASSTVYPVALLIDEAFLFPYPKFLSFPHPSQVPFVSILSVFPLFFLLFLLELGKGVYVAMSACI